MTKNNYPTMPKPNAFFLEVPLYKKFKMNAQKTLELLNFDGSLDLYCLDCGKISVFNSNVEPYPTLATSPTLTAGEVPHQIQIPLFFEIPFICSRDKDHRAIFYFGTNNNSICKIGEFPSKADAFSGDIQKYKKMLGKEQLSLQLAKQLYSQNFGAGSFVYLRRIFENVVVERVATRKYSGAQSWDFQVWKKTNRTMESKLKDLAEVLPRFINNQELFRVLSAAVHEHDEATCLQYFTIIEKAVTEILDDEIATEKKRETRKDLNNEIKKMDRNLRN